MARQAYAGSLVEQARVEAAMQAAREEHAAMEAEAAWVREVTAAREQRKGRAGWANVQSGVETGAAIMAAARKAYP